MRSLIALAAVSMALAAQAQPARDASPRDAQNTQGANTDAGALDPATKARVRAEGVPGGTGARVPKEASGGATVGNGDQHRHSPPKPPDPHQDKSATEKSADEKNR